jgi:16S rRNA C967 or C1407 C5-methylase (RsmB/RsmF family)/NOL1/NOP2/fmu family ribosome biogenesis protein
MHLLPPRFLENMQTLLGDSYADFIACYDQPHHTGLRVNPLKISAQDFIPLSTFHFSPIPWCPTGFDLKDESRPGKHPHHAAGLYYLQEPSAMAVAEIAAPQAGEKILDLAASPGGKSTHLASLLNHSGLLWSNEIRTKRIPALAGNLERWGARNIVISNEPPERLADQLAGFFDAVVVDAPCSGEGMFRKEPDVRAEWDASQIESYADRQKLILKFAARLVRPGGRLIYSTCTFNKDENENVIESFLDDRSDYQLDALPPLPGLNPSLSDRSSPPEAGMARIFPHLSPGEGHFFARLKRISGDDRTLEVEPIRSIQRSALAPIRSFLQENLRDYHWSLDSDHWSLRGDHLYFVPEIPFVRGLRINQTGFQLGILKKDRFEPAHAFAMTLRGSDALRSLNLSADDPLCEKFLRGETITSNGDDGWMLVCVDGFPLGWGKRVKGVIKNHLPSGLRWM